MKKILFVVLFLFFLASVFGLTLETGKINYVKGESISISGICKVGEKVKVSGNLGDIKIFESTQYCISNLYGTTTQIRITDPAGQWIIKAQTEKEELEQTINVKNTRESQFYLISIISPTENMKKRNEDFNVIIKVTDSGKIVENANTVFYDVEGKRKQLNYLGNGIYYASYKIPFNAKLKEWNLLVAAESEDGTIGGETSKKILIGKTTIKIEVLEPIGKNFLVNDTIKLKIKARYLNKTLEKATAKAIINGEEIILTRTNKEIFEGEYLIPENVSNGLKELKFIVSDEAENSSQKKINILIENNIISFIQKNYLIILIAIFLIILIITLTKHFEKKISEKREQKEEKEFLEEELQKLKKKYYEGKIEKSEYIKDSFEIQEKLRELKK